LVLGLGLLAGIVIVSLTAPWWLWHEPRAIALPDQFLPPGSPSHLLGTDMLGRDVLARTLAGARYSLTLGLGVALASGLIGYALGAIAAFAGGWADIVVGRLGDLLLAFPRLLLAMALVALVPDASLAVVAIVLIATGWAGAARLIRAEVLRAKERDYVLAARVVGRSPMAILVVHILPNVAGVALAWFTVSVPNAILAESALAFLGLGVAPGTPSWGAMINESRDYILDAWWLGTIPGLALATTVLACHLIGEGLHRILRPSRYAAA